MNASPHAPGRLAALVRHGRVALATAPPSPSVIPYDADRWAVDPRPELEGDSGWWSRLLWIIYHRSGGDPSGLLGVLHGLRCSGARLRSYGGRLKIDAGELSDEYPMLRDAYLVPQLAAVKDALATLEESR